MVSLTAKLLVPSLLAAVTLSAGQAFAQESSGGGLPHLRGFEQFHEPVGQPIYFESPFNDTGVRALYLRHNFGDGSVLDGGHVSVYAMQARVAITDQLGFIATKDGYSEIDTGLLGSDQGWNDIAGGFKFALVADPKEQLVITPGIRYEAENGTRLYSKALSPQGVGGGCDEFSPFVSFAKGFGTFHTVGNLTLRLPTDRNDGNTVGQWDLHADFDLNPTSQCVIAPVVEVHGLHYLSDGDWNLPIGGLDYANLGSNPDSSFVCWMSIGLRAEIFKNYEFGAVYEFALTDKDEDIMDSRFTVDFIVRF